MKNLLISLICASALVTPGIFGVVQPANAAVIGSNVLIKGSGPAVYWVAENGKRYAFPNIKTFWSWFSSDKFNDVHVINDQELATTPFGGVINYRPGAKLVKVQTSPKVYFVSRFGILHWVTTEALAATHYGADWKSKVEDIPDALFSTYTIGEPTKNAWEYNGGSEYNGVANPTHNLLDNLAVDALNIGLSKAEVTRGESVTLTASLATNAQIENVTIDIYDENKVAIKACANATKCNVQVALTGNEITKTFTAVATYTTPSGVKKLESNKTTLRLLMPQASFHGTVLVNSEVIATRNENPTVRVVATAMNPSAVDSDVTIRIYRAKDNALLTTCNGTVSCVATDSPVGLTGITKLGYFAIVNNTLGQSLSVATTDVDVLPSGWYPSFNSYTFTAGEYGTKTQATSEIEQQTSGVTLVNSVVSSQGSPISANDENFTIAPGTPVHIEATVAAKQNTDSMYVEIREQNGAVYAACTGTGTVTCKTDVNFQEQYKNHFFVIRVQDKNNQIREFRLANFVYVGGKEGFGGSVRILADKTSVKRGDTVYLSTKIMGETYPIAKLTTRIGELETGTLVLACNWTSECRTKTVLDSTLSTHRFYTYAVDDKGRELHASYAPQPVTIQK
ncbi:MAG: hypothetical protein AAB386_03085 [Patescibacteria group bacterium]